MAQRKPSPSVAPANSAHVLFVDDESDNLDALKRLFRKDYICHFAQSGIEALKILTTIPEISVIVSDQRMPGMSGVELFEKSLRLQPDSVRILVTGYTDIEAVIQAINEGRIYEYVSKPWEPADFKMTLSRALDHYKLQKELKEKNKALSQALAELEQLDAAKTRFLSLLSHELRTPLTTLTSYVAALESQSYSNPDELKKFIARLKESSGRLEHLVNDSLLFAQAQMQQIPRQEFSSDPFDRNVMDQLVAQAKKNHPSKKDIAVDYHLLAPKNPVSEITRSVLLIVLTKLIDNAIKYAAAKVTLYLYVVESTLHAVISDDGNGIPHATRDALFKSWADSTDLLHHTQGLGIGLKTAALFLQGVQGKIQILDGQQTPPNPSASELLKLYSGAAFHLSIPL